MFRRASVAFRERARSSPGAGLAASSFEYLHAALELAAFDQTFAEQETSLRFAICRHAVGAGFGQVARGDQVFDAAPIGHGLVFGVVDFHRAEHEQRTAVFAARQLPPVSMWLTAVRASS